MPDLKYHNIIPMMHILEIGYMAVPMVLLKQLMMPHMENTLNILMEHVTNRLVQLERCAQIMKQGLQQ